jgi:peptidoglycan/xylan/chitin deacetylase (PgdA/CDA1 family)
MNYCLMTNDVETTSINGSLHDDIGIKVWKNAMPRLLELYAKYEVKATFYFVADFAEKFPEIVKMVIPFGHEVACHGLTHEHSKAFDVLSYDEQFIHLKKAKEILENISGQEVVSFRAPALRVNKHTPTALKNAGFLTDSSIAPQRIDMFMSLGSKNKIQWLKAPRQTYETAFDNLARKGQSGINEFPVSGFGLPYIGTLMRLSPSLNNIIRYLIYLETNNSNKAVNFLIHPSEFVEETEEQMQINRRESNIILHYFSDVLRVKLKKKNLGIAAFPLFEKELQFWQKKGYVFKTVKEMNTK